MTTSALLRHGIAHMRRLRGGLTTLLAAREIESISFIRGCLSRKCLPDPSEFERANWIHLLQGYHVKPAV